MNPAPFNPLRLGDPSSSAIVEEESLIIQPRETQSGSSSHPDESITPAVNVASIVQIYRTIPIYINPPKPISTAYRIAKRLFDIVISLGLMILLAPLLIGISILIRLNDAGPILFRQTRIGLNGRPFIFLKFRTMIVNAADLEEKLREWNMHRGSITFKLANDPRITWIGKILRKTSIDELPQLWNVLCGQMTLVGPRPAVPSEVARYNAHQRRRLQVTPGLTCYWQVNGRSDLDFEQQVELDLQYIRERSFLVDLRILIDTIPAVLSGRGAY